MIFRLVSIADLNRISYEVRSPAGGFVVGLRCGFSIKVKGTFTAY